MNPRFWNGLLLGAGALAFTAQLSCNRPGYTLVEVRGRVTRGDQPMDEMSIQFRPFAAPSGKRAGPNSYAVLDADGRYVLRTVDRNLPGAVPGKHYVTITGIKPEGLPDDQAIKLDPRIPEAFRNDSVVIEVPPEGLPNADFDLTQY